MGEDLAKVKAVAEKVIANVRTMGMALAPCTTPASGKPGFELGETEMEMGIGIHGEPGTYRAELKEADAIVDEMLGKILEDRSFTEVAVMVNGFGGTPPMELYVVNNHVADVLAQKGIKVYKTFVRAISESLDMEGCSITLLELDDELKKGLDAPADTIGLRC